MTKLCGDLTLQQQPNLGGAWELVIDSTLCAQPASSMIEVFVLGNHPIIYYVPTKRRASVKLIELWTNLDTKIFKKIPYSLILTRSMTKHC